MDIPVDTRDCMTPCREGRASESAAAVTAVVVGLRRGACPQWAARSRAWPHGCAALRRRRCTEGRNVSRCCSRSHQPRLRSLRDQTCGTTSGAPRPRLVVAVMRPGHATITVTNDEEPGALTLSASHPSVGTAVTATLTDPDGSISSQSWQWSHAAGSDISGATSSSYTPVSGDVGKRLSVPVSYTDGQGPNKSASVQTSGAVGEKQNNAPQFSASTAIRSVAENTVETVTPREALGRGALDCSSDYPPVGPRATSFALTSRHTRGDDPCPPRRGARAG